MPKIVLVATKVGTRIQPEVFAHAPTAAQPLPPPKKRRPRPVMKAPKLVMVKPFPGRPPSNPAANEAAWTWALKRPCPTCHRGVGARCINLAPSHRAAGVAYETRSPHRERMRAQV